MVPGRYVYHAAPPALVGDQLVSLFALERLDPIAFRTAFAKYAGRESAPFVPIPGLGIRFNDAVHCAPIHPWYIRQARRSEGLDVDRESSAGRVVYRIPLESILRHPVVWFRGQTIWINGAPGEDVPAAPPADEFEAFDAGRYRELTVVPPAYRSHVRAAVATGRRPLMFVMIPHVLVGGPISLADAQPVDGSEPPDWELGLGRAET